MIILFNCDFEIPHAALIPADCKIQYYSEKKHAQTCANITFFHSDSSTELLEILHRNCKEICEEVYLISTDFHLSVRLKNSLLDAGKSVFCPGFDSIPSCNQPIEFHYLNILSPIQANILYTLIYTRIQLVDCFQWRSIKECLSYFEKLFCVSLEIAKRVCNFLVASDCLHIHSSYTFIDKVSLDQVYSAISTRIHTVTSHFPSENMKKLKAQHECCVEVKPWFHSSQNSTENISAYLSIDGLGFTNANPRGYIHDAVEDAVSVAQAVIDIDEEMCALNGQSLSIFTNDSRKPSHNVYVHSLATYCEINNFKLEFKYLSVQDMFVCTCRIHFSDQIRQFRSAEFLHKHQCKQQIAEEICGKLNIDPVNFPTRNTKKLNYASILNTHVQKHGIRYSIDFNAQQPFKCRGKIGNFECESKFYQSKYEAKYEVMMRICEELGLVERFQ